MAVINTTNMPAQSENNLQCRDTILICRCAQVKILPSGSADRVCSALASSGRRFHVVADLCKLAANKDPLLGELAANNNLTVAACFPRAVRWLFDMAGAPLVPNVKLLNLRTGRPENVEAELLKTNRAANESDNSPNSAAADNDGDSWVAWFPVIDRDRCRNCKQCMNFCLFGVYRLDEAGKVYVSNPRGCKTNCPACARMCPHGAIIFPKFDQPPINGQDLPPGWKPSAESDKLAGMSRGDFMAALRARGMMSDDKPEHSEDAG